MFPKNEMKKTESIKINDIIEYYNLRWADKEKGDPRDSWHYRKKRIQMTIFNFLDEIEINKDAFVIEIGCGGGSLTEKLSILFNSIIAFDISIEAIKSTRKKVVSNSHCDFLVCDVTKMPFTSSVFDIVIFSEVLEHVYDQQKAIKDIHRIVKPDGHLLLTTPNSGGIYRIIDKHIHKLRRKPYRPTSQIMDNPLSASALIRLLNPYFKIIKKRGLIYTLPYLHKLHSNLIIDKLNQMSELIENRNKLANQGLYQCLLCTPKK